MASLLRYAYLAELFLWVPLALFVATTPATRRWLTAPLVASLLAAVYEAYMTFVWEPKVVAPIRLDIFLVLFVTAIADAVAGIGLATFARGKPDRKRLLAAAGVCGVVPVLAVVGVFFMQSHTKQLDASLENGRRYRFEAAFRDDVTEKRVFGALQSSTNPWAGYYVAGGGDDRFRHLVISEDGRFRLYSSQLYLSPGVSNPSATDAARFDGHGVGRMHEKLRLALRREPAGQYLLDVDFGYGQPATRSIPFRKAAPPRFPPAAAASSEVRFLGVFSGTYDERDADFWLVQAWLWESNGEVWGRYIHDAYYRGQRREFIHPIELRASCSEQCRVITFATDRGPRRLERLSADEWRGKYGSPERDVTLRRGEILPGYLLDLAPVTTRHENREWLEAVLAGQMETWDVPAK